MSFPRGAYFIPHSSQVTEHPPHMQAVNVISSVVLRVLHPPPSLQVAERQLPFTFPALNLRNQKPLFPVSGFLRQATAISHGVIVPHARLDTLPHTPKPIHFVLRQPKGLDLPSGLGPSDQDEFVALFPRDDVKHLIACRFRTSVVAVRFVGDDFSLFGRYLGEGRMVCKERDGTDSPAAFHVVETLR